MANPYAHPRMRRLKKAARWRYFFALIVKFPSFLFWVLSGLIPYRLLSKLRKKLSFIFLPFRNVSFLFGIWIRSRLWKKLIFSVPFLFPSIWLATIILLAKGKSESDLLTDYRSSFINAYSKKNYKMASFLAGKLLHKESFKEDKDLLYCAMIAANENGNLSRREMLFKRLTEELRDPRAFFWYVQHLLDSQGGGAHELHKVIHNALEVFEENIDNSKIRRNIALLYYGAKKYEMALDIIDQIIEPEIPILFLKGRLHYALGHTHKAFNLISSQLDKLDEEDPLFGKNIDLRLEALNILSLHKGNNQYIQDYLDKLILALQRSIKYSPEDLQTRKDFAKSCYIYSAIFVNESTYEKRHKAIPYIQKSITTGYPPNNLRKVFANLSFLNVDYGMSSEMIRDYIVNKKQGKAIAHILLALSLWESNLLDDAYFHFQLAYALESQSLMAVNLFSISYSQPTAHEGINSPALFLTQKKPWQRAMDLIDFVATLDSQSLVRNLKTKSLILIADQRWHIMVETLEPHVKDLSDEDKKIILPILIHALEQSHQLAKMEKYNSLLKSLTNKQE